MCQVSRHNYIKYVAGLCFEIRCLDVSLSGTIQLGDIQYLNQLQKHIDSIA